MDIEKALRINEDLTRRVLTAFIRTELNRCGFQRAVVGLSGGVDSSVACVLATEALGPENVLAVQMPYRTSSSDSSAHAQLIIDQWGVRTVVEDITPMVEPYFERHPEMSNIRRGNVMSRARMIVLYDKSAEFNALVVGTSNKTELLLGYGTIFGDLASAVNPIGDLYKTQVRQLAQALGIPKVIIAKPPSADLWNGQTDEGELGFTYAEVDKLLYLLVDERYSADEAIAAGFDADFVHKVIALMRRNQFKRLPPIIAKLSRRTIGIDFLYPRDWGT